MSIVPDIRAHGNAVDATTNPSQTTSLVSALTDTLDHFAGHDDIAPQNAILKYATTAYLSRMTPEDAPPPQMIEKHLLAIVNGVSKRENAKTKVASEKLPTLRELAAVQVALVINRLHNVAEVTPGGTDADDGLGVLCIYQSTGDFTGLYRRADLGLLEGMAREYNFNHNERWFKELERALRGFAPKVTENQNTDLVVMRNCIYNYRTDERIAFSPDYVYLARHADTDLIDEQHDVPEVRDEAGKLLWNYEDWWKETVPNAQTLLYIHQVIGAALRPGHDWQKMPSLFSESGSNGKGTILAHIRAIVGSRYCASVPLKAYGSQFGKEQLIGKRLNLPDETPVGDFIKDASDLKAIITNDPISIDRKNKTPITYKPSMFTILTLNGALNFRDKTDSMDRRVAIVPMEKRFVAGQKNKAIKDDYLLRREVREYMAYKVLVEMPKYWELEEPLVIKQALQEHKRETNTVLAFFEEYKGEFLRPFVPFPMVRALYAAWLKENRPGSVPLEAGKFTREIKTMLDPELWVVPQAADGADLKLTTRSWLTSPEPVLDEFHYVESVKKWQWASSEPFPSECALAKSAPRQERGFMRRDVYEAWVAAGSAGGSSAADKAVHEARRRQTAEAAAAAQEVCQSVPAAAQEARLDDLPGLRKELEALEAREGRVGTDQESMQHKLIRFRIEAAEQKATTSSPTTADASAA
ncbi:phage/plasmid primase, P4 family [Brachybacterium paraconglomeratum]|uniref:phage/plasmid primase, P4 family n=1 Tax=Brachybacterium paraconglomeratum TaxID=173362 RepID=UPI0031E65D65